MVQAPNWVGVKQLYPYFIEDEEFMIALKNTLMYAAVTGPVGYILSFVVAWLINELNRPIRTTITLLMYAPTLAGNVFCLAVSLFFR